MRIRSTSQKTVGELQNQLFASFTSMSFIFILSCVSTLNPLQSIVFSLTVLCNGAHTEPDFLARAYATDVWIEGLKRPVRALFVDEERIWQHYCELPGHCTSLVDRGGLGVV